MKADKTSMFFNATIKDGSATPPWCTSVGQSKSNSCKFDDDLSVKEFIIGMNYKLKTDVSNLDITEGSSTRELMFFSVFDKVFINGVKLQNENFILLLVKEHTKSHEGRLLVSYPIYAKYKKDGIIIHNKAVMEKMAIELNCESGCWFVYDITIKEQDELHFHAVVVDEKPQEYESSSNRNTKWNELLDKWLDEKKLSPNIKSKKFFELLKDCGVSFDELLIDRLISSLLAKPFLILSGLAGSGKTNLAYSIAKWLSPNQSQCIKLVPVGADWTGIENILGYPNGLNEVDYISKPALDVILHALGNPHEPHFLILDEMNLSHVERYFSDILSTIESNGKIYLHQDKIRSAGHDDIYPEIELPKNLFIIGTVNIDETTHMFSPKVLDRANVIEFRMKDTELGSFLVNPVKPNLSELEGKGYEEFGKAFVLAAKRPAEVPEDAELRFQCEMLLFFKVLQKHGAEFGYRVAHEAGRFVHFYEKIGVETNVEIWFKDAFDCIIVQKFLPKLHGSESKLRGVLFSLADLCADKRAWTGSKLEENLARIDEIANEVKSKADSSENSPIKLKEKLKADGGAAHYPLSFEKIERMWRAAHDNGFASFAES